MHTIGASRRGRDRVENHIYVDAPNRLRLLDFIKEWQLLADTSFSDLVLWVPDKDDDNIFWAYNQVRPSTGPTALQAEVTGTSIAYDPESPVTTAYLTGEIVRDSEHSMEAGIPVAQWAIPVMSGGRCTAVVEIHTNQISMRAPGALEKAYQYIATSLVTMLHNSDYPAMGTTDSAWSPTVGDGLLLVEEDGHVRYASPNATSFLRKFDIGTDLIGDTIDNLIPAWSSQIMDVWPEAGQWWAAKQLSIQVQDSHYVVKSVPLYRDNDERAVAILSRDVTQLVERDREIFNRDLKIHEINHRVKNNLQTIAAVLRIQSRRAHHEESRTELANALQRVNSIAHVEELLSQSDDDDVDFDHVLEQLLRHVKTVASVPTRFIRTGTCGRVVSESATVLALIISELCELAVEFASQSHTVRIESHRTMNELWFEIRVIDSDLPAGFDAMTHDDLRLVIVKTLVSGLKGRLVIDESAGDVVAKILVNVQN